MAISDRVRQSAPIGPDSFRDATGTRDDPRQGAGELQTAADGARPLRILTVTNMWRENGHFRGTFVWEQVESIRALGHHVDVEVIAQSRGRRDYFLAAPRVRRRVRQGGYDVVHVHFGMTALAARFIGRAVPRVLTYHGGDVHIWWQRWLTKLGAGGTTKIYTSKRLADANHDPHGAVVACGTDPDLFAPRDQRQARGELGIDHDEPIVLFGGLPVNPVKDYPLFSAVLDELRARGMSVHELVLAELNQPRSRVAVKFAAADALLFTSKKGTEAGPMVIKEALVAELPIVSTDVGDVPEMIERLTPSACVAWPQPWGTAAARAQLVSALADALEKILVARSRSNGRQFQDRVDIRSKARAVVEVYRQAIARG
ncbi:MAG TPA: glycosyltransferase family 4 protein [Micromonosporaceae bacterium]|jgi:glycosyltransferase involved in cell wall biosynthesis